MGCSVYVGKDKRKKLAVLLRKEGRSYNEILKTVNVSQSTISLWLKDIPLTQEQVQRLHQLKKDGAKLGWGRKKYIQRISESKKLFGNHGMNFLKKSRVHFFF